jgi:hypothetical protein
MLIRNLINEKFGKLLVVSFNGIKNGRKYWNCICDCGNEKIIYTNMLTSGRCKSCGCLTKIAYNKEPNRNKAIIRRIFSESIKRRSKKLNLPYDISIEYFEELINKPCYYCGLSNSKKSRDHNYKNTFVSDTILNLNGIDRIDNNIGYIKSNVVTCCKKCNYAKNIMSQKEFKEFIIKLYNNFCV